MPRPKIIATVSDQNAKYIPNLYEAGVDIVRFNLKYLVKKEHVDSCRATLFDSERGFSNDDVEKIRLLGVPDYFGISFCSSVEEVKLAKNFLNSKIVAKIESEEGIANLYGITQVADIIMIARGDLLKHFRIRTPLIEDGIKAITSFFGKNVWIATGIVKGQSRDLSASELYYIAYRAKHVDGFVLSDEVIFTKDPVRIVRNLSNILELYA